MIITSNRQLTNPYPSAAARIIAQKEKKKEAAGPRIKTLSHHLNLHMDSNTRDEPFLPTNQPIAPNQQHRSINQHPQQSPPPTPSPPEAPNPREAARPTRKHRSHLRSTRREGGRPTASRETGGSEARSKTLEACLGGGGGVVGIPTSGDPRGDDEEDEGGGEATPAGLESGASGRFPSLQRCAVVFVVKLAACSCSHQPTLRALVYLL